MSRFDFGGDYSEAEVALWWANIRRALNGRKGQAVLREMRAALLDLPEKRLIEGEVIENGQVCALGALARYRAKHGGLVLREKGQSPRILTEDSQLQAEFGDLIDDWDSMNAGQKMGLTRILAWRIAYENDEGVWGTETPDARWSRVLRWVESGIQAVTP